MACATIVGPFTVVAHPGPDLEDDHLVIPIRLDSFTRNIPNNLGGMLKTIARICPQIYDWDFNVFELFEEAETRPLFVVTMAIFEMEGLMDGWLLDRTSTAKYFAQVESVYRMENPYHNNTHAADVTQTAGVILQALKAYMARAGRPLSKLEIFCVIFASAVHDLGHPGVNNDFLIRTRERQALVYNDKSVNENMHASLAFQIAHDNSEMNIFSNFSDEEYKQARSLIVDMVLSTDMAVHFDLLKTFAKAVEVQPSPKEWNPQTLSLVFQMLVHLADLANPSRPFFLALKWAERVITEFMNQGDQEEAAGLEVSAMCDKNKICMPNAQLFFIANFMKPTLDTFAVVAPAFAEMARPWLADTTNKWTFYKEAGVRFPATLGPVYPELPAAEQQALEQLQQKLAQQKLGAEEC